MGCSEEMVRINEETLQSIKENNETMHKALESIEEILESDMSESKIIEYLKDELTDYKNNMRKELCINK